MSRRARIGLVLLVAASAPGALVFETLVRRWLLPPELDELRGFLTPWATSAAWTFAAACLVAGIVGFVVQRRWCATRIRDARICDTDPARAVMDRTFLSMSIPQVPAILSTVAFMSGSELAPVLTAMTLSSVGVIAQGLQWERLLGEADG